MLGLNFLTNFNKPIIIKEFLTLTTIMSLLSRIKNQASKLLNVAISAAVSVVTVTTIAPKVEAIPVVNRYNYTTYTNPYTRPIDPPKAQMIKPTTAPANKQFSYNNTNYINAYKLQDAMRGVKGAFVVTDSTGKVIAAVGKDTMLPPASVSKLFTTVAALEAFPVNDPRSLLNYNNIGHLKIANSSSDNLYFEALADRIGIDNVQSTIRRITGNNSIVIGNGSGCGNTTRGNGEHSCGGRSKSGRSTKISVGDTVKVVQYLDLKLRSNGKRMEDVLGSNFDGNSTLSDRYKGTIRNAVTGKTGTLNGLFSLAGIMYGPANQTVYFATVTEGSKTPSILKHIEVLNAAFN
jgi:hypothetical protein